MEFKPWWAFTPQEMLLSKLEDRGMAVQDLSDLCRIDLKLLNNYLSNIETELPQGLYLKIEEALNLPTNYFNRLKELYLERLSQNNL